MPEIIPTIIIGRVARIVADDATVSVAGWFRKIHIVQEGGAAICVEMSGASPHALSIASADVVELTEVSGARGVR